MRKLFVFSVILFVLLANWPFSSSAQVVDARKPRIGIILALSGPVAPVGNSIRNAMLLAQERFDPERSVEFVFEDDQFQAKVGVSAAEKLISRDKVDALITFSGAVSAAVSELAERRKVPMLAITSLSSVGRGKRFVYSIFIEARQQAALLSAAIESAGFESVAIVTTEQDAMLELRDLLVESVKAKIVSKEDLLPGDIGLHSVITRIKAKKPDAVINLTIPPQVAHLSRQLREVGFSGQFLGGAPMFNPPEIQAANGALFGAWLPGPSSARTAEFYSRYMTIYNESCLSEGLYGFDAVALLIAAAKSGNISSYLDNANQFTGLAGTYPKNDWNVFVVPVELKQITPQLTLKPIPQ